MEKKNDDLIANEKRAYEVLGQLINLTRLLAAFYELSGKRPAVLETRIKSFHEEYSKLIDTLNRCSTTVVAKDPSWEWEVSHRSFTPTKTLIDSIQEKNPEIQARPATVGWRIVSDQTLLMILIACSTVSPSIRGPLGSTNANPPEDEVIFCANLVPPDPFDLRPNPSFFSHDRIVI